jgi:hypothetical protein
MQVHKGLKKIVRKKKCAQTHISTKNEFQKIVLIHI